MHGEERPPQVRAMTPNRRQGRMLSKDLIDLRSEASMAPLLARRVALQI